jgi:hypothetical protein
MSELPHNWANWVQREACRYAGGTFVRWAEPAPEDPTQTRYAVAQDDSNGIRWWRFSPNPDVLVEQSSGCFYGDDAEKAAAKAALTHKKKHTLRHRAKLLGIHRKTLRQAAARAKSS